MSSVSITYFGMAGTGRTVTEAKKDAGGKIEAALRGSYEPKVLASRGHAMLVWRDPHGWRSSMLTDADSGDDKGSRTGFREELSYSSGNDDFHEAYASALSHLAQLTWDGQELLPPCLEPIANLARLPYGIGKTGADRATTGRRLLADFASWRGFQLAYKQARKNGTPEHECHRWACEHGSEYTGKEFPFAVVSPEVAEAFGMTANSCTVIT